MLHFLFSDSKNTLYDCHCNFKKINNQIEFICENNKFLLNCDRNSFLFIKDDDDSIFELSQKNLKATSSVLLKEKSIKVDVQVDYLNYEYNKNNIKIEYILESDKESLKTLEIKY